MRDVQNWRGTGVRVMRVAWECGDSCGDWPTEHSEISPVASIGR